MRAFVALSLTFVLGCTLPDRYTDHRNDPPSGNAPPAAPATHTGTGAKNEKDVLRYANETKVADEPHVVAKDGTKARTFPATGADVATLARGTSVVEIAKYFSTGALVVFDDPVARNGTKLMGWVAPESLAAAPAAAAATVPPLTPVAPVAPLTPARFADGAAPPPKPAPVPSDAGGKGRPAPNAPTAPTAPTAPKSPPAPPPTPPPGPVVPTIAPGQLQVIPNNGQCPPGMTIMGPFCRRPCQTDAQCPPGTFCTNASGPKSCAATK